MGAKHYKKLGKTKIVRLPEAIADWAQEVARELDEKSDPQHILETLTMIIERAK